MLLRELEIVNFRSIKGRLVAPLDANIVLVHGENGAGKTSLLSAIELALTGRVLSLERSDPAYQRQLLHWSAQSGRIDLSTNDKSSFKTDLSADGAKAEMILPDRTASFFTERCYLPQSLLGQLLSIYQTSNEEIDSPLARFVGELLGLDRLDALDVGLKPLADLRNFRKIAEGYSGAEAEKTRLERLLSDHRRSLDTIGKALATALAELAAARSKLDLPQAVSEQSLDQDEVELSSSPDEAALTALADQRRRLDAIRREARQNQTTLAQADEANLAESHTQTLRALDAWQRDGEVRLTAVSKRAEALLPSANLPAPLEAFNQEASRLLRSEQQQISDRLARATQATERQAAAAGELEVARKQLSTVEGEIGRIAPNSGDLGTILSEISSFIRGDVCPVCDRNFAELNSGSLADHVHMRVRTLSSSAQRLLDLSRTRGQHQSKVEALEREIAALSSRLIDAKQLSELSRSSATLNSVLAELEAHSTVAAEGDRLIRAETAARRALADFQSRSLARASLIATLREFALVTGQEEPGATEIAEMAIERLSFELEARASLINQRVAARRAALEAIRKARAELARRSEIAADVESDNVELKKNTDALARANGIRATGQTIRSNVERVRVDIIRREFNDRLNKLWRDLFVRLAPNEPFVPAFKIPDASTPRIQPKLITQHRGGGSGGTPGAMLSAGNLNTAALTLFVALHLSVSPQLPWLILDDPVQSMDDVHIANFAALLRTLAKQQRRQVLIAVHDRQLFEYLRLELSPAFPDDSLLALELSRGAHRDSLCIADRRSYQEETAIRVAA
jgi:exonuclease SbcC